MAETSSKQEQWVPLHHHYSKRPRCTKSPDVKAALKEKRWLMYRIGSADRVSFGVPPLDHNDKCLSLDHIVG